VSKNKINIKMKCKDIEKLLPDYIEQKLNPELADKLKIHLGSCTKCEALYKKLLSAIQFLKPTSEIEEQPFYYTRLKQRMQNESNIGYSINLKRYLQPLAYVASIVIAVYIGILIGSSSVNQKQFSDVTEAEKDYLETFMDNQYINELDIEKIESVFIEEPEADTNKN